LAFARAPPILRAMIVHLVDGTYELFRHFHSPAAALETSVPAELRAVHGVVNSVLGMLEGGATHLGVATDHVIESFRNDLWAGYKTGEGIEPELLAQFVPVEEALGALGVTVWPMVEFEADDALAAAAALAAADPRVERVVVCTPDKDLAQVVRDDRIVQLDRRTGETRDEAGVRARFGVPPAAIPDWLALVGDSADGFPGVPGWGAKSAAAVLAHYGRLEDIPTLALEWKTPVRGAVRLASSLAEHRDLAMLFRTLATLRADAPVGAGVDAWAWTGPRDDFAAWAQRLAKPRLLERALALRDVRRG
jgi:5'-3' exonuclease